MTEPALADTATLPTRAAPRSRRRPSTGTGRRPPTTRLVARARSSTRSTSAASPTANGDGTGDLAGVRARLPYLRDLGVDAIWFTPVVRLAAGRRRLRRRRLPGHRPGLRDARGGRGADRRGARRSASGRSSTSSPTTSPSQHPWFQAALAAGPGSPERERFWFRPGRGPDGDEHADRLALGLLGRPTWTRTTNPTGRPASGTCTCSRPSSPTSTGTTPTSAPSTRRSSGSGSTAASPASASTPRRCWSRTRRCPRSRTTRARASIRSTTATSSTTSTAAGAPIADAYPGDAGPRRRGLAPGRRAVRPLPAARRAAHRLQLRLHGPALGRRQPARVDRRDARRPRPGRGAGDLGAVEPRRHPAGHALRPGGHLVRVRPQAVRDADRPRARAAAGRAPRRCSRRPCPARCTSTRATSSASTRSTSRSTEIQDPMYVRSGGVDPGRDGCRVPLPWSGRRAPFGFSPRGRGGEPWLPQPAALGRA